MNSFNSKILEKCGVVYDQVTRETNEKFDSIQDKFDKKFNEISQVLNQNGIQLKNVGSANSQTQQIKPFKLSSNENLSSFKLAPATLGVHSQINRQNIMPLGHSISSNMGNNISIND